MTPNDSNIYLKQGQATILAALACSATFTLFIAGLAPWI